MPSLRNLGRTICAATLATVLTPIGWAAAEAPPNKLVALADTNGDGQLTLAEIQAKRPTFSEERFTQWDSNKDGVLDGTELERRDTTVEKSKKTADTPDDFNTYLAHLVSAYETDPGHGVSLANLQAAKPGFPKSAFVSLDRDKDGLLTLKDERGAAAPKKPSGKKGSAKKNPAMKSENPKPEPEKERKKLNLKKADANQDGKLSYEELSSAYPEISRERFDRRDRDKDGFLSPADRQAR